MDDGFTSIDDLLHQQRSASGATAASSDALFEEEEGQTEGEAQVAQTEHVVEEKMESFRLDTLEDETRSRADLLGIPYISLQAFPIGPDIISLIPEEEAREHKVISFFRLEGTIRLGVVDPDDPVLHDIIARIQHLHSESEVVLHLISQHSFDSAVKLYKNVAKVRIVEYGVHITKEHLDQYKEEITSFDILAEKLPTATTTEAFAMLISAASAMGSSDVHIESEADGAVIRFRIDGILADVAHIPPHMVPRLISRIKGVAGLKINVTTIPQDGRITIEMGKEETLEIRVSSLPSAFGESIVFRLLHSSSIGLNFEELGIRDAAFQKLNVEIAKPNGMIITTGPTGSGKTTTLYAILNKLNQPGTKIITLENPIEYKLKGIVQSQIDHSKKYTFEMGLRSILRQDPDIVMVGEIRDTETAQTAIDAALTGHLMLSTIHTNDAAGVVPRFLGMGINGIFLAPALNAVIGQRLVRRICEQCKTEYTPPTEEVAKMKEWVAAIPENSGEVPPDVDALTFYKGKGCQVCGDTGYKGRVGIYEIFTIIPEIEQQILSGRVSEFQMKEILAKAGMVSMGQDGMLKVAEGITTLEEVFRVAKG